MIPYMKVVKVPYDPLHEGGEGGPMIPYMKVVKEAL